MSKERLQQLEKSEVYASYQAEFAFEKELNILRNDFYYQMIASKSTSLVDFMYRPLDTLSGDAYSARRIDEYRTFYLLVDEMGKGVSASFTAVIFTSFVNHLVNKMINTVFWNMQNLRCRPFYYKTSKIILHVLNPIMRHLVNGSQSIRLIAVILKILRSFFFTVMVSLKTVQIAKVYSMLHSLRMILETLLQEKSSKRSFLQK